MNTSAAHGPQADLTRRRATARIHLFNNPVTTETTSGSIFIADKYMYIYLIAILLNVVQKEQNKFDIATLHNA